MKKITRRQTLQGAATVAALGLLPELSLTSPALAARKLKQKAVQYQEKPKDGHQCDGCRHFKAPHSCDKVAGTISPKGWCMLWAPKA